MVVVEEVTEIWAIILGLNSYVAYSKTDYFTIIEIFVAYGVLKS